MIWKKGRRFKASLLTLLSGGPGDTTAPTVTITSSESSPSFANPIPLTFTLSEVSTNFAVGDITVGAGGSIGNFAGSGASYTADLTVTSAGATITVDVAADSFTDAAGNGNTAATQFSITSGLTFYDAFTTDDATPLATPRTMEPGPGAWNVTQTAGTIEIVSSRLEITGPGATSNTTKLVSTTGATRTPGRAFYFDRVSGNVNTEVGFRNTTDATTFGFTTNSNGTATFRNALFSGYNTALSVLRDSYIVAIGGLTGLTTVMKWIGKTGSTWKLLYVATADIRDQAESFYIESSQNTGKVVLDNCKSMVLGTAWQSDYGIATARTAAPANGETLTGDANGIYRFLWTCATNEVVDFMFRRTDDNNCWILRCDEAANKVYLYEKNASVETERGATGGVAQTLNNGSQYQLTIVADTADIYCYVFETRKITYASATFNQSATGLKISGFATGSSLEAWPRIVTPF